MSALDATSAQDNDVSPPNNAAADQGAAPESPFKNKSYFAHWLGTSVSGLGDFFTLIAMPWLVLSYTSDKSVLGMVLALQAVPRAVFILLGGAITDRISAKTTLFVSYILFMTTLLTLSALLLSNGLSLWMIYGFALSLGLISAFSMPASESILPQLVDKAQLPAGNAGLMGTRQISKIIAPVLAGLVIWGVADPAISDSEPDRSGLATAFAVNALTFALALIALWFVKPRQVETPPHTASIFSSVSSGFRYLFADMGLVTIILYMCCLTFFAVGPLTITIPLFAEERLQNGALDFGLLFTINGIGALFGYIIGPKIKQPKPAQLGLLVFGVDLVAGAAVFLFGGANSMLSAGPCLAIIGICNSISMVVAFSWIQQRIAPQMMGRAMSLMMFAVMGLTPISMATTGFLIDLYSLTYVIYGAGIAIMAIGLLGMSIPGVRGFAAKEAKNAHLVLN